MREVCEESVEEVCTHTTEHVTELHTVAGAPSIIQTFNYVQNVPIVGRTGLIDDLSSTAKLLMI